MKKIVLRNTLDDIQHRLAHFESVRINKSVVSVQSIQPETEQTEVSVVDETGIFNKISSLVFDFPNSIKEYRKKSAEKKIASQKEDEEYKKNLQERKLAATIEFLEEKNRNEQQRIEELKKKMKG